MMNLKEKLYVGGMVLYVGGMIFFGVENYRSKELMRQELRTVHGRLAEIESDVYCNARWIKDLQDDTADADAIKGLDERFTRYEYQTADEIEEVKTLLEALKASQTDAKEEKDTNTPSTEENAITGEIEAPQPQSVGGDCLTATGGVYWYGEQKETWYNLPMEKVIEQAQNNGIYGEYWVREDGCKMYGDYIILACNRSVHPMGSLVETSLGTGISLDTGAFADVNPTQVDIAVGW